MSVPTNWSKADLWGPPRPRPVLGPRHALWGLAWFVLVQLLVAAIVICTLWADPSLGLTVASSGPAVAGGELALWAVFVGYPLWVSRFRSTGSLAADFRLTLPRIGQLLAGIGLGLALRAASIGVSALTAALGGSAGDNTGWLNGGYSRAVETFLLVGTCLLGPLAEEMFFRGVLMTALERWTAVPARARVSVAIAVSSLAFGASHASGANAGAFTVVAQTAILGALLALAVRHRRGGLAVSAAIHVAFNTSGVVLLLLGIAS